MWACRCPLAVGAGNGIRTRDIQLGRLTLYQLSYSRGASFVTSHFEKLDPFLVATAFSITLGGARSPETPKIPEMVVEGEGFEPSKACAGRFTVCSLWPARASLLVRYRGTSKC